VYFFSPLLPLPLLFSCVLLRRESFTVDCGTTVERRDGSDPHPVGFVLTAGGAQRSRLPPPPAERTGVRAVRRDVRSSRDQSASTKTQRSRQPAPNGRRRSATRQLTTSEPSSVEGGGSPEPAGVRESAETCVGVRRGLRVSPQPKSAVVQCSPVQSSAVQCSPVRGQHDPVRRRPAVPNRAASAPSQCDIPFRPAVERHDVREGGRRTHDLYGYV